MVLSDLGGLAQVRFLKLSITEAVDTRGMMRKVYNLINLTRIHTLETATTVHIMNEPIASRVSSEPFLWNLSLLTPAPVPKQPLTELLSVTMC